MIEREKMPDNDHDLLIEVWIVQKQQDKRLARMEGAFLFVIGLIVAAFIAGLWAVISGGGPH